MKLTPSDPDLQTIVARIRSGDIDLQPDFQRGEVWPTNKKRRLIDSILRDWHIPPIHVVVNEDDRVQEVLDGQQRLAAIRDFVDGDFTVDGTIEPHDTNIEELDGLTYGELPPEVKRGFDQFTIRMFKLTDYKPGEPGELFFRLNQMTYLTAAEQRNAFFGPVRKQVRSIVTSLEDSDAQEVIGFSNRRMAYDDVIAKFLCTLEIGSLAYKLPASEISDRFREDKPFSKRYIKVAKDALATLNTAVLASDHRPKFNKATLFSWLIFLFYFSREQRSPENLTEFLSEFESARGAMNFRSSEKRIGRELSPAIEKNLFRIFSDRSSSRVSDISSLIFRDVILWLFYLDGGHKVEKVLSLEKLGILKQLHRGLMARKIEPSEIAIEKSLDFSAWGNLR